MSLFTILEYVANLLWMTPLVALVAAMTVPCWKGRPDWQHRVWVAALGISLVLPAVPLLSPGRSTAVSPTAARLAAESSVTTVATRASRTSTNYFHPQIALEHRGASILVCLYGVLLAFGVLRGLQNWLELRRLLHAARELAIPAKYRLEIERYCDLLDINPPEFLESPNLRTPAVKGMLSPCVLVPAGYFENREEEVKAGLWHEFAHIKRKDYLLNILYGAILLPVWFHPAARWIRTRIRVTREIACDALATSHVGSRYQYARALLAFAKNATPVDLSQSTHAICLIGETSLEERIMTLIHTESVPSKSRWALAVRAGLTGMAVLTITTFCHCGISLAQAEAKPMEMMHAVIPLGKSLQAAGLSQATSKAGASGSDAASEQKPGVTILRKEQREMTPEEKAQLEKEMGMTVEQLKAETSKLQSPEVRKDLQDALKSVKDPQVRAGLDEATRFAKSPALGEMLKSLKEQGYLTK